MGHPALVIKEGNMTLMPCASNEFYVVDYHGPEPEDEQVCAHPRCANRGGLQRHHVIRRSETGGPVRWVAINGVCLLNERRFCRAHHDMLTGEIGGHRGWVRYLEGEGWAWYAPTPLAPGRGSVVDKLGAVWSLVGPLKGV